MLEPAVAMLADPKDADARHDPPPSPEVAGLLDGVLEQVRPEVDALVMRIAGQVVHRVPGLLGDEVVLEAVERTSRANMLTLLDLLAEPGLTVEAHPAAVALAGAFVHGDHPLSALIEAYRVGQALFFEAWLEALADRTDDAALLGQATAWSYRRGCIYLDTVLARTSEQYLAERRQWQGRALARRWSTVQAILDGSLSDDDAASQALGYDIAMTHLAVVVANGRAASPVRDDVDLDPDALLAFADVLAQRIGGTRALALPAGPGLVYAWVGLHGTPDVAALAGLDVPVGVRVALGAPARGSEGFRASHQQALWAQHLTRTAVGLPAVVSYPAVSAACLLREDHDQIRGFVAHELGGLARRDSAVRELRTTLRVALEEGLNASRAASRLCMHKNTVLYRLRGAEDLRGRPLTERRLELELALRIVDTFGDEILG